MNRKRVYIRDYGYLETREQSNKRVKRERRKEIAKVTRRSMRLHK